MTLNLNNNNIGLGLLLHTGETLETCKEDHEEYFSVSIGVAVKLLYPLIRAEFESRGYSKSAIDYRLHISDAGDVELIDIVQGILAEFDEGEFH